MFRRLFAVALGCSLVAPAFADDYKLTGENTKVEFTGTKPGGKHDGGFKTVAGTITADGADLTALKVSVEIDCGSLYSDDPKLTGHLKAPDFFNVKEHPKATFTSTKVTKTDKGYDITGDLTLCGKSAPVTMPATVTVTGDTLTLKSEFKIDRTQWGMSYGKGKIDDQVALRIDVTAKK